MKILFVAMKYDYGDPSRGLGIEHHVFYETFKKMGHKIIYFDFMQELKKIGKKAMNKKLLKVVDKQSPDLLFSVLYQDQLEKQTINQISKTKTITLNWFCDDTWRFDNFSKYWAPNYNWVVTTDSEVVKKYHQIGYKNVIASNWGFNHHSYSPPEKINYRYDISFIGQPHGYRKKYLNYLKAKGIKVDCWGQGWPNGRLDFKQMYDVFSHSRININFTGTSRQTQGINGILRRLGLVKPIRQMKARLFEVPGSGGFLLTEEINGLDKFFNLGKEMATFSNKKDLLSKVNYFLQHDSERETIAKNGRKRVLKDHTYEKRLSNLVKIISSS